MRTVALALALSLAALAQPVKVRVLPFKHQAPSAPLDLAIRRALRADLPTGPLEMWHGPAASPSQVQDLPMVLWGRTWRYGSGHAVEAFLSVRKPRVGAGIWKVPLADGTTFSVDIPRTEIEFAPMVLGPDLAPLHPSEIADYCGGLVRLFERDWTGAAPLFQRVAANPRAPVAVRVDAHLYLAVVAEKTGGDSFPQVRQAYQLNPYSRITLLYLCMSHLAALSRGGPLLHHLSALSDIVAHNRVLFLPQDGWFDKLRKYLARTG